MIKGCTGHGGFVSLSGAYPGSQYQAMQPGEPNSGECYLPPSAPNMSSMTQPHLGNIR